MQVSVLASGSKGNSIFVEAGGTKLLVDAGISARRIRQSLAEIDVHVGDLDGILITHEHRDHINGLKTLTKQYRLPIYTRMETLQAMFCSKEIPQEYWRPVQEDFHIGAASVRAFNISHDAADPVGYMIHAAGKKCTVATDLGFVTSTVQAAIDHSDLLVLEANHDPDLLQKGSYPWMLKKRILSNRGHLSNNDAAWALVRMQSQRTQVLLAHLSEENNRPEIARDTICQIALQQGCDLQKNLQIHLTKPDEIVTVSTDS